MDATGLRSTAHADQSPHRAGRRTSARRASDDFVVHVDLPDPLPITEQEVALITRHLGGVIAAILNEPD